MRIEKVIQKNPVTKHMLQTGVCLVSQCRSIDMHNQK